MVLLLGSCGLFGADDDGDGEEVESYFRATLNGEEAWSGKPDAAFSQQGPYLWLAIGADSVYDDFYRESLTLATPFEGPGEYTLVPVEYDTGAGGIRTAGATFYESDDDVQVARYRATADSSANHLTITSYDSTAGILEGRFRTTVVVAEDDRISEPGEPPRRRADTLRFEEGTFRVKVRDLRK
ncbi:MAG: hypothetical protein ACR2GR_12035 [Rhodothermales bacterium]